MARTSKSSTGSTFNNAFALASPSLKAFTRRRLSKDTSVPEPGRRTWTTGWAGSGKTSHDFLGEGSGTAGTCVLVTSTRRGLEAGPGKSAKSEAGPGTRPSRCPTARRPTGWPSAAGSLVRAQANDSEVRTNRRGILVELHGLNGGWLDGR